MQRLVFLTTLATGLTLLAPLSSASAAAPPSVERAYDSIIRVIKTSDDAKSAAFAVNDRGDFLTTSQAVSRSAGLKVLIPGQKRAFTARKVESDAPPGLALIHVNGAPKIRALTFAGRNPGEGTKTWVVAPRTALLRPREALVKAPEIYCTRSDDLITVGAAHILGTNGSPVLNARGQVLGVVRASRGCANTGTQVVRADAAPMRVPELPPPTRASFPAVPVVLVLGFLLLVANLGLRFRTARAAREPFVTTAEPARVADTPAPAYDDDLEITLRKK